MSGVQLLVAELCRLLANSADESHWLDDHLRYISSQNRADWQEDLYVSLQSSDFRFTLDDFRADYDSRQPQCTVRARPKPRRLDFGGAKGVLMEEVVQQILPRFFSTPVDQSHMSFNQIFSIGETNLTEWDFVYQRSPNCEMPVPKNEMKDPYKYSAGGEMLVGEVWNKEKPLSDLAKKLAVLFPSHRPIHTLHYFAFYSIVSGGFVYGKDLKPLTIPEFLAVCIAEGRIDLSVLCAAGRVMFCFVPDFERTVIANSAHTISALYEQIDQLQKDVAEAVAAARADAAKDIAEAVAAVRADVAKETAKAVLAIQADAAKDRAEAVAAVRAAAAKAVADVEARFAAKLEELEAKFAAERAKDRGT